MAWCSQQAPTLFQAGGLAMAGPTRAAATPGNGQEESGMTTRFAPERALTGAAAAEPRPTSVTGPFGVPLTLESLPPPDTNRWVARRKAEILAAINGGLLTLEEACVRYRLSVEELQLWQEAVDRAGVPGLRVTRIQLYRDFHPAPLRPAPASQSHGAGTVDGSGSHGSGIPSLRVAGQVQ